jgi:hypothetical protein
VLNGGHTAGLCAGERVEVKRDDGNTVGELINKTNKEKKGD